MRETRAGCGAEKPRQPQVTQAEEGAARDYLVMMTLRTLVASRSTLDASRTKYTPGARPRTSFAPGARP
jgi:hypothetical protein